jgi:hypothetical protein
MVTEQDLTWQPEALPLALVWTPSLADWVSVIEDTCDFYNDAIGRLVIVAEGEWNEADEVLTESGDSNGTVIAVGKPMTGTIWTGPGDRRISFPTDVPCNEVHARERISDRRMCIISDALFFPTDAMPSHRIARHEIGHTLRLHHHENIDCTMDAMTTALELCEACLARLRVLYLGASVDTGNT